QPLMDHADEGFLALSEDPRTSDDEGVSIGSDDGALAGELRPSIFVDRARLLLDGVEALFRSVENVVAAEVHDRGRVFGEDRRTVDVYRASERGIVLALVHADDSA